MRFSTALVVIVVLGAVLGVWRYVEAANLWTYEQDFEDLNIGDLQGQDSWTGTASGWQVNLAVPIGDLQDAVSVSGSNYVQHSVGALANGTFYIDLSYSIVDYGPYLILLNNGGLSDVTLIYQGGDLYYYDGNSSSYVKLADSTPGVAQRIGIAFECGGGAWEGLSAGYFKLSVDNGSWTAEIKMERASRSSLDVLKFFDGGFGGVVHFDNINPLYEEAGPPPGGEAAGVQISWISFAFIFCGVIGILFLMPWTGTRLTKFIFQMDDPIYKKADWAKYDNFWIRKKYWHGKYK